MAILFIVLFHLLPALCPSGYIGVDVFLVISGYFLLGRQLIGNAEFRFFSFLIKKGQRLLVPYCTLLLLVALATIVLYPACGMLQNAVIFKAGLLGKVNMFLDSLGNNYFSTDTRTLPIMHLWYMGVMMQSYLLFSLLFLIWKVTKCRSRTRVIQLCLLGGISFALAFMPLPGFLKALVGNPYYSTTARLWEFALGGLIFVLPKQTSGRIGISMTAIAVATLFVLPFIPLPSANIGVLAGAVCGGIMLIWGSSWAIYSPLDFKLFTLLGGISFSLYLIHWPCICFAEAVSEQQLTLLPALALCVLILPLSIAFHKGIENPAFPAWGIIIFWILSAGVHKSITGSDGFRKYIHQEANQLNEPDMIPGESLPLLDESSPLFRHSEGIKPNQFSLKDVPQVHILKDIGDKNNIFSFIIIGDSHAQDFAVTMHHAGLTHAWRGIYLNSYITPFWGAELKQGENNAAPGNFFNEDKACHIMDWMAEHPEIRTVFICQYWRCRLVPHTMWNGDRVKEGIVQARAEELRQFCERLQSAGKNIIILTDGPEIPTNTPFVCLATHCLWHRDKPVPPSLCCDRGTYELTDGAFNRELDKLANAGYCQVIHRENAFFSSDTFRAFNGEFLTHRDTHHLTIEGGLSGIAPFIEQFKQLLHCYSMERFDK